MRWIPCALLLLIYPAIASAAATIAITFPVDNDYTNSQVVNGSFTGTTPATVDVNGVNATVNQAAMTFSATLTGAALLVEGSNTITATLTAVDGTDAKTIHATFDETDPAVTIAGVTPAPTDVNPNATYFKSVRVIGTAMDLNPIDSLTVRGVSGALPDPNNGGAYDRRAELNPGVNTITVRAIDAAGNAGSAEYVLTRRIVCQDPTYDPSATYTVDRNDDLPDADLSDDVCDVRKDLRPDPTDPNDPPFTPPRKKCSLRAAIQTANHHDGDDRILLSSGGLIRLNHQGAGEDAALTGDLDVTQNLRIFGNGRDTTLIDGSKLGDRVFDVRDGAELQLLHLALQGGHAPQPADPNDAGGGGCLRVSGGLHANSAAFLSCRSEGSGGAIALDEAKLTLRNSTLALNSAGRRGGAISALGSADPNDLVLSNVTLSRNKAKLAGGALDLGAGATAKLNNCTFANNGAKAGASLSTTDDGQLEISNSILGDQQLACDPPNSAGAVISMGGNVERGDSCLQPLATDQQNKDPLLDKLATNKASGGPPTHALKVGSPAIDLGGTGAVACEPLDARDTERRDWPRALPDGSSTSSPPFCDAGALELLGPVPAD
ncbi:MAG TPA: choice-of-anchor Q domain-containing protein [Myxococcota bacterium]|nr:choice-of-anchor Q domain-containing protein [Myxococcota bacterium]